jgi:hypothetical protein
MSPNTMPGTRTTIFCPAKGDNAFPHPGLVIARFAFSSIIPYAATKFANTKTPRQRESFTMVRLTAPIANLFLVAFAGLDIALWALDHSAVPKRDLFASAVGLAILTECFNKRHHTKALSIPSPALKRRMDKVFHALSTVELLTTILIPWGLILQEQLYGNTLRQKESAIYILASHLFIFQTQIAGESLIASIGTKHHWMLFPFTAVTNTYRLVPLLTWLSRAGVPAWEHPLPLIGLGLWAFSNLYFIPFEWWPVLQKAKQQSSHT